MSVAPMAATYAYSIASAIRASLADRGNFLLQAASMVLNNGFMLALWFMFFAGFHSVGGWRLSDMALLVGIIMTIVGVTGVFFGGYRDLAATILSGEIDALLTQPRSILVRLLARDSIATAWGDLFTGAAILAGFAHLTPQGLPWFAVGWSAGLIVYLAAGVTFASMAFWLRGARSLARDLVEFVILACSYPGSIYSGASKLIAYSLLPAGFIVLTPVKLLRTPDFVTLATLLGAALIYAAIAAGAFHLGLRRYQRGSTPTVSM